MRFVRDGEAWAGGLFSGFESPVCVVERLRMR